MGSFFVILFWAWVAVSTVLLISRFMGRNRQATRPTPPDGLPSSLPGVLESANQLHDPAPSTSLNLKDLGKAPGAPAGLDLSDLDKAPGAPAGLDLSDLDKAPGAPAGLDLSDLDKA
ncbi:MAG: hypothetical protein GY929_02680, partial [Actinomycetia bacterium]|nr:hypothetical protein [Actinomycetes bacterium]